MEPRRLCILATSITILGLFIAGCASSAPTPAPKPRSATAASPAERAPTAAAKPAPDQPKYGGVLPLTHVAEPASFDIHQESGGQHPAYLAFAYNRLLQHDPLSWPEPKIMPDLAESWEIGSGGSEYTFRPRSGAKWHDGKPFTSEDVKVSLDRIRKPPKGMRSPREAEFACISEVEAVAPGTVRIRLNRPSASFFTALASDWLAILPKHVIEAKGDMKREILGTGPFKFKAYSPGSSYEYVKDSEYFVKGRPYLDGIKIYVVKDSATRFAALRTGRALLQPMPYGVTETQAAAAREDPHLVVKSSWRPSLYHFRMNLQKSPWSDPRVRRAASLALDRQAFIATVLEGAGLLGAPMPSKGLWGIPEDELLKMPGYRQPKEADIAEARRLLAEAGFPQAFNATSLVRSDDMYRKQGTFVLAELAKIDIKGELDIKVTAAFDDALTRGAFETVSTAVATAIDDPDQRFGENYITGAGRNYGKYSSRALDELYEKQSRALDENERKKLVREILAILLQDNPDVPLGWGISTIAHSRRVRNWNMASSPYLQNNYQEVWLAD